MTNWGVPAVLVTADEIPNPNALQLRTTGARPALFRAYDELLESLR